MVMASLPREEGIICRWFLTLWYGLLTNRNLRNTLPSTINIGSISASKGDIFPGSYLHSSLRTVTPGAGGRHGFHRRQPLPPALSRWRQTARHDQKKQENRIESDYAPRKKQGPV